MSVFLALLLWMPPPPPPPPDQMAAAEEVLRLAPVPSELTTRVRDQAISSAANGFEPRYDNIQTTVRERIASHLAGSTRLAQEISGCLTEATARSYDTPTLKQIGEIVATAGGQALWHASLPATVEQCYREKIPLFLQYTGYTNALRWFVRKRPSEPLPRYDGWRIDLDGFSATLTTLCGRAVRQALLRRAGRLGVADEWQKRKRNGEAFSCLLHGARLAGYDLPIFGTNGEVTVIGQVPATSPYRVS